MLRDKKNRDSSGLFIAEGAKLLCEALDACLVIERIFFTNDANNKYSDLLARVSKDTEMILVSDECYQKLTDEKAPQGVFCCIRKPSISDSNFADGGYVILDNIQNPLNVGAIIRCAYSLGASKLILSKGCADPYSSKAVRAAMGSLFKSQIFTDICTKDFILEQKRGGNRVFCTALHSNSKSLSDMQFESSDNVIFCNEGHGADKDLLDICTDSIIIPMLPGAESLNAATAAAIVIWEMKKDLLTSLSI